MADKKFDQFTDGGEMRIGDIPVGLRGSNLATNYKFDFPGTGIKDGDGNYLFRYATAGAAAVNYPKFINSVASTAVQITADGADADIDVSFVPKGNGKLIFDGLNWPTADGSANTFLYTDGAGNLGWSAVAFPIAPGAAGTIIRSTGAAWAASTATFANTYAANSILYASAVNTVTSLSTANGSLLITSAAGVPSFLANPTATGRMLRSVNADAPAWSTAAFADTYAASTLLYSNGANNVQGLATANSAALVTNGAGVPAFSASMTNGQLLIGNTGNAPSVANLTAGSGITISNTAGGVTISSSGGGYSWTEVTGTSQPMSINNGYIANNAALVTLTLPVTAAVGDTVSVQGKGTGLFSIAQNVGQTIHFGAFDTTTGIGGSLTATNRYDSLELICITDNTDFAVLTGSQGNFTTA